jgi:type II secretory pathway component PulF
MIKSDQKKQFLDESIESFLQSHDKSNFSGKEKILFYKELVYMMKGGVSLIEAMQIIFSSSANFAIKTVAKEISSYLRKGQSLSYAISRLPDYFDEGDAAIIKT